jgi:hypothetical protein
MNFHFPLMPRLFMSLRMEDRYRIIDIMQQARPSQSQANGPSSCAIMTSSPWKW